MAGVHDVISEYVSILESNVSDPNSTRASKNLKWIYDDIPRADLGKPSYPRISVVSFSAPSEPHALCSNEQRLNARIEIQIRVRRSKWNSQTAEQFADDITLSVINAMRADSARASLLSNANVFQSVLESENTTYSDDILVKQLIYKNIFVR